MWRRGVWQVPRDRLVETENFNTNSYVDPRVDPPPHSERRRDLPFHVEMSSLFLHGEPHAFSVPRRCSDGSIIFAPMRSALDTRPLRANTPSSLQSQSDPSTGVDGRIRRRRRPMSMVHRVSTPYKHRETGCMCIENMAWKPRNQRPRPLYRRRIRPSTPVDGSPWRPRKLGVLG